MKTLIVSSCFPETIADMYDEAYLASLVGKEVYIFDCDSTVGCCWHNIQFNHGRCVNCEKYRAKLRRMLPQGIRSIKVSDVCDRTKTYDFLFKINNIDDIKHIKYHDINVGYACLSVYITKTRNNNPRIDDAFLAFFNKMLQRVCYYIDSLEKAVNDVSPDQIMVFNGRCTNSRPAAELAQIKGIEFICSELKFIQSGKAVRQHFLNALPHSISKNEELIHLTWDASLMSDREKQLLGSWFYESKMKRTYAGDKDYTTLQKSNLLPSIWNSNKHNIVILNSSEDEFSTIGDEFDSKAIFKEQVLGIKHIAELLNGNDSFDVYLRIHPNLKDIKYKYHTDLLSMEGKYSNFTIIPANSDVSTYSLIKNADKIIVFGSTTGIEAVYHKKPVVLLAGAFYYGLNCCHIPHSIAEADAMILDKELPSLYNENVLKYGYFNMDYWLPSSVKFDISRKIVDFNLLGTHHEICLYPYKKFLGSKFLARVLESLREKLSAILGEQEIVPYKEE